MTQTERSFTDVTHAYSRVDLGSTSFKRCRGLASNENLTITDSK